MSTVLQQIAGLDVVDDGDGLFFLKEPGGKIRATFFKREPWPRWWVGRDLYGAAREVYVDQSVPDDDQVTHVAERLTRPA